MCQFVKICTLQQMFSCAKEIFFFLLIPEENYMNRTDMVRTEPDAITLYACQKFLSLTFLYTFCMKQFIQHTQYMHTLQGT